MKTEYSILKKKYSSTEEIGSGSFGSVLIVYDEDGKEYALKMFKNDYDEMDVKDLVNTVEEVRNWVHGESSKTESDEDVDLYSDCTEGEFHLPGLETETLREVSILRMFSKIQPKDTYFSVANIIHLTDICWFNDHLSIVMPRMVMDLIKALEQNLLTNKQKVNVAHKLISAVAFLHKNNIIHRDVKTDNVLLDRNMQPYLCDFSLAKIFDDQMEEKGLTHTTDTGTSGFRAPEQVWEQWYSFASDVWSTGVVLVEMFDGILESTKDKKAIRHIQEIRSRFTSKPLPKLMKAMLHPEPDKRVTCEQALNMEVFGKFPKIHIPRVVNKQVLHTPASEPKSKRINNPAIRQARMKKGVCPKKKTVYDKYYSLFKFDNKLTITAARQYHEKSKESELHCMLVASKIYEFGYRMEVEELITLVPDFNLEKFMEAEKNILRSMNFCLYV